MSYETYRAMTPHSRIWGYTYNAGTYCRGCMNETICEWADFPRELRHRMRDMDTESALDIAAEHLGIDRREDHDDFPKPIIAGECCQEDCGDDSCDHEAMGCGHDTCDDCGIRLCKQ